MSKMAARTDARLRAQPFSAIFMLFLFVLFLSTLDNCLAHLTHSRHDLIEMGRPGGKIVTADFIRDHNIPNAIARTPGEHWFTIPDLKRKRRRKDRRQRRGCRGGLLARMRRHPDKPAVPSIFLSNVRSLANKMDELRLTVANNNIVKDSCLLVLTETWLQASIADSAVALEGRTAYRADRTRASGKRRGGGLLISIKDSWCSNSRIVSSHCSPELEYISVKCRPVYLPREFTAVSITAVYIPPDADANTALVQLYDVISKQQRTDPEAIHIIGGDFNHANLKVVLPKFYQHVKCATRGVKTLDKVYSNIKLAYRSRQMAHLGQSDHLSILLVPAYTPIRRSAPITTRNVTTWPADPAPLQLSLYDTRWEEYEHVDLERFTESVLRHIKNCVESFTKVKSVRIYPNTKPWMTREVQQLLRARDSALKVRETDKARYNTARANLNRGIKKAKAEYKVKIEGCFLSNDSRRVWQGVQHMTNFRANRLSADGDNNPRLAEELNTFFARFEVEPTGVATPQPPHSPDRSSPTLTLTEHDVRRTLKAVNPRKATGPDGVPGRVLRDCSDQLTGVLTKIFNQSLLQGIVPTCLKTSIIIPVPKKSTVSYLNDHRPVALTSTVMKCFEKRVRDIIMSFLPPGLDNHQFAYRANRSTEDAIATALHSTLSHLEESGSYVRLLFVDFSSAFNTIIPDRLVSKLTDLGLPHSICAWIKDFLSDRPQRVRVGSNTSTALRLSTGSPQGCVLSPLLYSLYTYDFTAIHPSNSIIKFADDTTVVGRILGGDETAYRDEVEQLSKQCKDNNLLLNQLKTQEIIVDFRRKKKTETPPLLIDGDDVGKVAAFRFLGVHIQEDLSWRTNTKAIIKKAQQRLHFLRILRSYHLRKELLVSFYRSSVESILTYCICVWFSSCTAVERKSLQRVVNTAQRIIGCSLPSLESIYNTRCLRKATKISRDPYHPGSKHFVLLRSERRFRVIGGSKRLKRSFYPSAIKALNKDKA